MSQPAFPGRLNREDPDLSDRHREVFGALVELHERTARPVSSEALARRQGIPLSPASIRSALAELEDLGLLERLHASGARVPSAPGYEYFVRTMLTPAVLPGPLLAEVARTLGASARDVEQLLNEASRLLSSLTHQLGLALAATLEGESLLGLDLVPLSERRALMALGLGGGAARSLVLELESDLEPRELEEVAQVLRERLVGQPLAEVRRRLAGDAALVRDSAVRIVTRAASDSWSRPVSTPLFAAGVVHIAEQPEFADSGHLAPILRAVEVGSPLDRLMVNGVEGQVVVRVGLDEDQALAGCSLVSYPLPGSVRGAVGILGPLRMNYSFALAVVESVGSRVYELLQS
jgi:heat-inducible transcriptional repressor